MTIDVTGARAAGSIHRSDYEPPLWRVHQIALDVDLDPASTRVKARLSVERSGEHGEPLRLNSEGLQPLAVIIDDHAAESWTMDDGDLIISLAGNRHSITTEVLIAPGENQQLMGLYATGQTLCTQCEAQGFRWIKFFPDRPDARAMIR